MKIVNLTPNSIHFLSGLVLPPSGDEVHCHQQERSVGNIYDIPLVEISFGDVSGLPPAQPDTIYIVPGLIAAIGRDDVFVPALDPDNVCVSLTRVVGYISDIASGARKESEIRTVLRISK